MNFWQIALSVGGIAAIGLFVFLSLYKNIFSLPLLNRLTRKQIYNLILISIILIFFSLIASFFTWFLIEKKDETPDATIDKIESNNSESNNSESNNSESNNSESNNSESNNSESNNSESNNSESNNSESNNKASIHSIKGNLDVDFNSNDGTNILEIDTIEEEGTTEIDFN